MNPLENIIIGYDLYNPQKKEDLICIEIKDFTGNQNKYCVGFQLVGENPKNMKDWVYDHCCYWDYKKNTNPEPENISRDKIENLLAEQFLDLNALLHFYISKI